MKYGFKNKYDEEFPSMVVAEICNVCNLKCLHCGYRKVIESPSYKPQYLELSLFKKIVDEVIEHKNSFLRFTSDGEPLLHKDLIDMIEYAKNKGIYPVTINTNGMLLNSDNIQRILSAGIDIIEVSINAFTKETYNKLRINADYDILMKNIFNLVDLRNTGGYKTKIMVSTIDMPLYKNETNNFQKFWKDKVDKIIIRTFFDHQGLVEMDSQNKIIGQKISRFPCPQFWKRITVAANGWIKYCVNDWYNKTNIADLRKSCIKEIWNSDLYKKMRLNQLNGNYDKIVLCGDCTDWKAMNWNFDYNTAVEELKIEKN